MSTRHKHYPEAMKQFVAASETKLSEREMNTPKSEPAQRRAQKRALRQEAEVLRAKHFVRCTHISFY
jgi:hypothetical protein